MVLNKDIFNKLIREIKNQKLENFSFINRGASKMVFSFIDEITNQKYVIKVDGKNFDEDELFFLLGKTYIFLDLKDKGGNQVEKEILFYKYIISKIDIPVFIPTLLDYSDENIGYSIQPYAQEYETPNKSFNYKNTMQRYITNSYDRATSKAANYILDYFLNEDDPEDTLQDFLDIYRDLYEKYEIDIFEDCSEDNLGVYNGRIVIIDYGYFDFDSINKMMKEKK